ncbi:glycine-rich domain-containing protein [Ideonella paludis]|uniref:glycine-rich domain-containing protein n=1 Tax=Ideonella paludis TaxID=1233411 RepID=UPI00362CC424
MNTQNESTTQAANQVARVTAWQSSGVVARIARKCDLSADDADQLFAEVKIFLLRSSTSKLPLRPSRRVDAGWHEFLMFTREYQAFCMEVLGKFVHHCPEDAPKSFDADADCVSCFGQQDPDDQGDCSSKVDTFPLKRLHS